MNIYLIIAILPVAASAVRLIRHFSFLSVSKGRHADKSRRIRLQKILSVIADGFELVKSLLEVLGLF